MIEFIAENIKISCCHMRHAEEDDKDDKMKIKKKVNKMDVSRMMMMR